MNENSIFTNRELSWLSFNDRVLNEALDNSNPLMEKLKFVAIFSSNLDEFFMVRVAGLKDQELSGLGIEDLSGQNPTEQLHDISESAHTSIALQQKIFKGLCVELEKHSIIINPIITGDLEETAEDIFIDEILSVITPVTLDPAHPFPFIYNRRISIIVSLKRDSKTWYSLIMLPENMRRFFVVKTGHKTIVLTAEYIIKAYLSKLYKGFIVEKAYVFRVTRDADLDVREEEAADLISLVQDSLSRRNKGAVTRIETEPSVPHEIQEFLKKMVVFKDEDVYVIDGLIDLTFLFGLSNLRPALQFPPLKTLEISGIPDDSKIFDRIKEDDLYFFRPYYSFSIVSRLIAIAAGDPNVLAIKMTLYRANGDSSILASLAKAAKSGKQVSVVIELKARFDEERNINWAQNLEEAGCIVTYGIVGLKIHAKCLLVIRKEGDEIVRYTHVATGNYNENTAKVYTDVDLITADEMVGRDAAQLFNYLMGYTEEKVWRKLYVAPYNMRQKLISLFDNEIEIAKKGQKSVVIMKMNSLIDKQLIEKMYEASKFGVRIDLIVRGICGLKAQVKGLSDNITVRSIVGRFLEHARVFYFSNGGSAKIFIASADLMPRNLNWRVELMTEITNAGFKAALKKYLKLSMDDNTKAWTLSGDRYIKRVDTKDPINSQMLFLQNKLF